MQSIHFFVINFHFFPDMIRASVLINRLKKEFQQSLLLLQFTNLMLDLNEKVNGVIFDIINIVFQYEEVNLTF